MPEPFFVSDEVFGDKRHRVRTAPGRLGENRWQVRWLIAS
ncbi:hypothetical protein OCAR_4353 [Afipia carboxidovorans OM5]|nr:hypothetical protein OCAR_4353 [Afipia carboxidovorans OM5]